MTEAQKARYAQIKDRFRRLGVENPADVILALDDELAELRKELKVAADACDRLTPKKPTFVDVRFRNHGRHVRDGCSLSACYKCPNCQAHIFHVFDSERFCVHCGQALDWEKEAK